MHVAEIWRYPVKSMGGERLTTAVVGESGIEGDRQWGVVDAATGLVLTARREPRLLFAAARLEEGSPVIEAADGTRLGGDEELSRWLGRSVSLVGAAGRIGRYEASVDRYLDDADWVTWEGPHGSFHDSGRTQVSLVARESLHGWDRRRFRFNLVLEGGSERSPSATLSRPTGSDGQTQYSRHARRVATGIGPVPASRPTRRDGPQTQYSRISSTTHAGSTTGVRGPISTRWGLMSSTGVPSMASRSATRMSRPSTPSSRQVLTPMRLGRALARWAKMPTRGQSGRPRG